MPEANTQNLLLHDVEFLQEVDEPTDPELIGVSIAATSGDDKATVSANLIIIGKLPTCNSVDVPFLSFFPQHFHEHPIVPSVLLLHVLWVLCAQQNCESLLHHFPSSLSHTQTNSETGFSSLQSLRERNWEIEGGIGGLLLPPLLSGSFCGRASCLNITWLAFLLTLLSFLGCLT